LTRLIVGLGNPGPEYVKTRHNIGFMAAERLSERWKIPVKGKGCSALFGEGKFLKQAVRLAVPQTFMNASGKSVACLLRRWKLQPSEALVICDDVSLPLGMIRLRGQGSAGGHLGLTSILEELGTAAVPRLRVGIRSDRAGEDLCAAARGGASFSAGLTPFVLGRFAASEEKLLEQGLGLAGEACEMWISRGLAAAMNRFNQKITER